PPQGARYKIYIIDEVHMLSQAAFNAFLKTLEEPPHYAIFILATTEKHKILPTILSRCQIFDFNRIGVDDMANHLASIAKKEDIKYEDDGLHIIAQKADGGLRDALSMFDQIVSFSDGNVTYRSVIDNLNILDYDYYFNITDSLLTENTAKTLLFFDEILTKGFDGAHFISGLSEHFRNLLVTKDASTLKLLEVSEGIKAKYLQQSQAANVSFLLSAMNIANQCDLNYKLSKNQRLQVELALLKMCHLLSVFSMATTPLTAMPDNEQLKKKHDTAAISTPKPPVVNNDVAMVADTPAPYTPSPKIAEPVKAVPESVKETPAAEKPKPVFIPNSGNTSVIIPSLKNIGNTKETVVEEEDPYLKGDAKETFTFDDFLREWNTYASKIKNEGKMNLLPVFITEVPAMLQPHVFEIIVANKVQEDLFRDEKPFFLNYMRSTLKNFELEVNARIDKQVAVKRPYTSQEKYQHMAAKNPQLAELRKRFNLDFD
ncbi:MAG: DNA polymerase III subunit gamma/tau, partial [Mucilaginibacter sp.]|nr:DNA polymerase III subunit gamma/tau [Mucilaginibacter sp.]